MEGDSKLPPLPPSDPSSLQRNVYDGFYKVKARDFWKESDITYHKVEEFKDCDHYFVTTDRGVECSRCHVGYVGSMKAIDGKLVINSQPI